MKRNRDEACLYGVLTGLATSLDGARFALCTTLNYGHKPAANTTLLSVKPQATDTLTTTKTPEQLQQEAEEWLTVWHEFTWQYPWYRMHFNFTMNSARIDIGFNPALPGGETWSWQGLEIFSAISENLLEEIVLDVVSIFSQYLVAKALSLWNPAAGIITEFIKFGIQMGLLVWLNWNNAESLLASALVSFVMGITAILIDFGMLFIQAILRLVASSTATVLCLLYNKLVFVLMGARLISRWWIDGLELALDWTTGIFALARNFGWI